MRIAVHDYAGHPFQFELSRQLAREGHEVRHFFFEGDPGPKGSSSVREEDPSGFGIEPIAISTPYRKDRLFRRRAQDIEYGRKAGARIAAFEPEVVLSGNTPLEAQAPILAASRRAGAAFVFWMQDFYSQAVKNILGGRLLGGGSLAGFWYERMEAALLARSDAIVVISEGFVDGLRKLNVPLQDVAVIPNWGALHEIPLRPRVNAWSETMGLSNTFTFLYSGTLGLKHDPQLLLALADAFADDPSVRVIVAAVGAGAEQLAWEQSLRPRPNLVLKGLEPIEALPDALAAADVMVALLEPDAGRYSVPSKVLSYLCAGKPTLLSAPLENLSSRILDEAGAGCTIPAGDRELLLKAAIDLRRSQSLREQLGTSARAYAEHNFDIAAVSARFTQVFDRALAGRSEVAQRAA